MLTRDVVAHRYALIEEASCDRETKVVARTLAGVQCGLAGMGSRDTLLTFPRSFLVGDMLSSRNWVRKATQTELAEDSRWWRPLEVQPAAVVHSNANIATEDEPVGMIGEEVLILAQLRDEVVLDVVPMGDLSGVCTPPTPPNLDAFR